MKGLRDFVKTTIMGGLLLVVLPVAILVFVFQWLFNLLGNVIGPVVALVLGEQARGYLVANLLVLVLLLFACSLIGAGSTSLIAALGLTVAHRVPELRAMVDYFGPDPEGWYVAQYLGYDKADPDIYLEGLPPLFIIHGGRDPIVPVKHSRRLYEELRRRGKPVELKVYPISLHALNDPDSGLSGDATVADDARRRAVEFLDRYMKE